MKLIAHLCIVSLISVAVAFSQTGSGRTSGVFVDSAGVMRWHATNDEVSLFGVNYTTPFAYSYRAHKRLGLSLKKAIDLDVAHLARLGLDAYRLHIWDREVSDENGNLISNEHLDLFDYLLAKLAERGFKIILTPIAWWGTGWPEPDEVTKGFSQHFSKQQLMTDPKAREAQRNYLRQFALHTNPYRKSWYKNDPSIIAFEIINEPRHPESGEATTQYVNEMAGVLRDAGLAKPVFFNISENWSDLQANAVTRANIDGVSFQWYPTDLVHNRMLTGNYLPNVAKYAIPSENVTGFNKKARMVYEFDAADVGGSYMYPAMARSFREAGMQFATMFSYDPAQIAWSNTEYPTHFVNLLYTPSKALSLLIAAKAFRNLPRGKPFGAYPENNEFGDFRVSYGENLSEMNSGAEFVYSNSTQTAPKDASSLIHVAGCGNSQVVRYDGTGAYLLDKLERGIWRLEIYPDALWLDDPFGPASMSRQAARLFWRERKLTISLPDLGPGYSIHSISDSKHYVGKGSLTNDTVWPGTYIVAAKGVDKKNLKKHLAKRESVLDDLYQPATPTPGISVVNSSSPYMVESGKADFKFQIAAEEKITNAFLFVKRLGWRGFSKLGLRSDGGFSYVPVDTPKMMQSGVVEYCVTVDVGKSTYTFPEGKPGAPGQWDFSTGVLWTMNIIKPDDPIVLLDARRDRRDIMFPHWSRSMRYVVDYGNGANSEETALALKVTFSEGSAASFGFHLDASKLVKSFGAMIGNYRYLTIKARSGHDSAGTISILFLLSDGTCFGADAEISNAWREVEIPLSAFRSRSAMMLPDSYPLFLPKVLNTRDVAAGATPDLRKLESIQIVLGPLGDNGSKRPTEINCEVTRVVLTR